MSDPIDDLCARLTEHPTGTMVAEFKDFRDPDKVLAADALQRLRAERDVWKDKAETRGREGCEARAERDTLAAIVRAADTMRRAVYKSPEETGDPLAHAYDSARAKWEGK